MKKAVIILAHGSKKKEAKDDLLQITQTLEKRSGLTTKLACMQLAEPTFLQTVAQLRNEGFKNILVVPFFLTNGHHMQEDIPRLIEEAGSKFGDITTEVSNCLWPDDLLINLLENKVRRHFESEVLNRDFALAPQAIEQESFNIIDNLIKPNGFDMDELQIVKRLIHATGDPNIADYVTFSGQAVNQGISALQEGLPVITDVSMVASGINKKLTSALNVEINTLIADAQIEKEALDKNKTRAQTAIKKLALNYPKSIIAIGNAPTALLEVANLIKSGRIRPSLVIAMPVGFVGTLKAKKAIKSTGVEYICVENTRGGSNLAAAAINALLKIAVSKKEKGPAEHLSLTTGMCAAAAAKAATFSLYQNKEIRQIKVNLPQGKEVTLEAVQVSKNINESRYYVQKPDNADPDVTKKIRIFAKATKNSNIKITAGDGIGRVTKPGLAIPPGKPAINPVPLKVIKQEVRKVLPKDCGVNITLSVPNGNKIAAKTFNEKLGIVGGISILGTTGLVKPMSVDAFKTSLAAQIDIAKAAGYTSLAITPGNIGKKAALKIGFDKDAVIICSNFVGYMLDKCKEKEVQKITLIGHLGKLLKIAGGHFNTHSRQSKLNLGILSPFIDKKRIKKLNSAEEATGLLIKEDPEKLNSVADLITRKINEYLGNGIKANTYLVNLKSQIVGASRE